MLVGITIRYMDGYATVTRTRLNFYLDDHRQSDVNIISLEHKELYFPTELEESYNYKINMLFSNDFHLFSPTLSYPDPWDEDSDSSLGVYGVVPTYRAVRLLGGNCSECGLEFSRSDVHDYFILFGGSGMYHECI